MDFIQILESSLGMKAKKEMKQMQPGDVEATCADINMLKNWIKYKPNTSIEIGIRKFALWYKEYFNSDYYQ